MTNSIEIFLYDENGDEITMDVPAKWSICSHCEGEGRVENPAFEDGISGEDWNNEWEDEERELYLSGAYDVRCDECKGTGKVQVADVSGLTEEERARYEQWLDDDYNYQRECAAERRAERYC